LSHLPGSHACTAVGTNPKISENFLLISQKKLEISFNSVY
jgi:hypothetical protein